MADSAKNSGEAACRAQRMQVLRQRLQAISLGPQRVAIDAGRIDARRTLGEDENPEARNAAFQWSHSMHPIIRSNAVAVRFPCLTLLLAIASGFFMPEAGAQRPDRPQQPTIWLAPDQGTRPILLSNLDISIQMTGFIARTTLDLTFDNPNNRVLEGEFVFPLAAGQTIAGYALEVNGAMREGVVVDKQTARVAFEETSRQRIDPGLAELTAGNVFRTRLYPIPARGSKRVRLHIESTLTDAGQSWRYRLPMHFNDPVRKLHIRAEAALTKSAPIAAALVNSPALTFERTGTAWIAELRRENVRPQSELVFDIPKTAGNQVAQIEAVDPIDPVWRSVIAQIDTGEPADPEHAPKPKRIAIFFDASSSARDRDINRELAALKLYLQTLDDTDVALIAFRNDADVALPLKVRNGNARPVLDAITALPLDGGSSYGAIDLHWLGAVDRVIVIGDGLSNFGDDEAHLIDHSGRSPPVWVLHAAQRADHARLARIARSGGGQVIDLTTVDADTALALMSRPSWRLTAQEMIRGECRDLSPAAPIEVTKIMQFSARCRSGAQVRLRFGAGDGREVVRTLGVGDSELPAAALAESVHRLWAQAWIDQLEATAHPDAAAITSLAKRYGVVTRGTSLLVLDRIEDYVRYRVEPKEAALRADYARLLAKMPKTLVDSGMTARLASLAQRWKEFADYHAAAYPGIESRLVELSTSEAAAWRNGGNLKPWKAGLAEAETLRASSEALVARWLRDGAEPDSRQAWEAEAARVVFGIQALRAQREKLPALPATDEQTQTTVDFDRASPSDAPSPSPRPALAAAAVGPASTAPERSALGGAAETMRSRRAEPTASLKEATGDTAAAETIAHIELSGWNPDTPYLAAIRAAKDPYAAYLLEREVNGKTPSFYLDVADHLRALAGCGGQAEQNEQCRNAARARVRSYADTKRLAMRVLSNLAELDTENTALTRVLAYRLAQWDEFALAVPQFERALEQRGEEPQSYRDLALALSRAPTPDPQRAVELLWQVAIRPWDGRFPDVDLIALHELNDVIVRSPSTMKVDTDKIGIDERFLDPVPVGLRVVLGWDADNTDIDLWVTDPVGDKVFYSVPRSPSGGHITRDFTGGYGPEVFTIRRPLPGTYIVEANYFGDRRQSLTGPVTVQLEFQTRFGSNNGEREVVTRRLEDGKQTIEIGRFTIGAP